MCFQILFEFFCCVVFPLIHSIVENAPFAAVTFCSLILDNTSETIILYIYVCICTSFVHELIFFLFPILVCCAGTIAYYIAFLLSRVLFFFFGLLPLGLTTYQGEAEKRRNIQTRFQRGRSQLTYLCIFVFFRASLSKKRKMFAHSHVVL